ncbi:MAG: amidohydrolase, partial [Anaerolineae bacterium]
MLDRAQAVSDRLVAWRRAIHEHPELSFQEIETARLVADALQAMGIDVETGIGRTGDVGRLSRSQGSRAGPTIGLRADMDA